MDVGGSYAVIPEGWWGEIVTYLRTIDAIVSRPSKGFDGTGNKRPRRVTRGRDSGNDSGQIEKGENGEKVKKVKIGKCLKGGIY